MTIQEAKAKVDLENDVEITLLGYISYLEEIIKQERVKMEDLESKYLEVKKVNEAHKEQVGGLYKELDEK